MRLPRVILAAAIAATSVIAFTSASANKPTCSIPTLFADAFSSFGENDLAWGFMDENPVSGNNGYVIQVARQPVLKQGGGFADFVDGKPNIKYSSIGVPEGFNEWTVEGLDEETYYYHIRVAPNSPVCNPALDPWSNIVATTQDHTAPEVTTDVRNNQVFLPGDVTMSGTATDEPGDKVAFASGATSVEIRLDHTTPLVGVIYPGAPKKVVEVAEDGTWTATYEGLAPGSYRAEIRGWDAVGNASEWIQVIIIVVNV